MQKTKGFTIIELLVVIAIIAVLAAVVLVNVTQYIAKGKDARIKSDIGNIRTVMSADFADNQGAAYVCPVTSTSSTTGDASVDDINTLSASDFVCNVTSSGSPAYCASAELATSTSTARKYYCTDSTGVVKESATSTCGTATACPD